LKKLLHDTGIYKWMLLSLLGCFASFSLEGQTLERSLVSVSSSYYSDKDISVSYSIGEPLVDGIIQESFHLLQGMEQPEEQQAVITTTEIRAGQFTVYPNPATDHIMIKFSDNESYDHLVIYNILGDVQKEIKLSSHRIDLSDMAPGTYLFRFSGMRKGLPQTTISKITIYK
jgi:hypothetical protein